MSKFASTSVLLLSLAMIAAGALVPQMAVLAFLAGIANYVSIAGFVLLIVFLIARFGIRGILYFLLYIVIFYVVQYAVGFVFGLLGLGGLAFDLVGFVLACLLTSIVANKIV